MMAEPWTIDGDERFEALMSLVKPELRPGERLLWASRADRPSPTNALGSSWFGLAWGLGLAAFAVDCFGVAAISSRYAPETVTNLAIVFGMMAALIAPVVLIGTGIAAILRKVERRRLTGRMYALTDSRALIWNPAPRSTAFAIHTLTRETIKVEHVVRLQQPDGSGDVLFQAPGSDPLGFLGVADVRRVEELIRRFLAEPPPLSPEP